MNKVSNILLKIFAAGVLFCLFAGGLSVLGYAAALVIGGESATALCLWIFKTYFPWIIRITSVFTGIGLLGMYLSKQKALSISEEKK